MIRPGDRFDVGRRAEGPIDVDRLDLEGPLATRWGVVSAGAYQRSFWTWVGLTVFRVVLGPYVLVLRSQLPTWAKVTALCVLAAVYGVAFAACLVLPAPR